jgi:hypothetical protein
MIAGRRIALALALLAALAAPVRATVLPGATPVPLHTPGANVNRVPIGANPAGAGHTIYGTIVQLDGAEFTLRLRDGRTVRVDPAEAIKRHELSYPIFVNKVVSVQGRRENGVFHATNVTRLTRLSDTAPDN